MVASVAGIHLGIDIHANRPAANTAPDGSLFSCTTHALIYKSNYAGNSWATWATLGGSASVATDTIWDAAGDLAVGTGADAAARLAKGSALQVLRVNAGATALEWAAAGGGSADAAGTLVNSKAYAATTSGGSIALGFTPTNGNTIYGYLSSNSQNAYATGISQTNVTWTLVARHVLPAGNEQTVEVWKGVVAASPGTSATITYSTANAQGAAFEEWSGLTTADSAMSWNIRNSSSSFQEQVEAFPWPRAGGRVVCVVGNSTGNAIAVPAGWTRNLAAGNYGGSASLSVLTLDASAGDVAATIQVAPVASDVHIGLFVHLKP